MDINAVMTAFDVPCVPALPYALTGLTHAAPTRMCSYKIVNEQNHSVVKFAHARSRTARATSQPALRIPTLPYAPWLQHRHIPSRVLAPSLARQYYDM